MPSDQACPHCGGRGEVTGVVDDVQLTLPCVCAGGSEEAVRWLPGPSDQPPPGEDWVI
jgi:hypothetical protein